MSFMIYNADDLTLVKEKFFKDKGVEGLIDNHFDYLRTLAFKDNIVVFFHSYDTDNDQHVLFAQKFDNDGEFIGDLTIIDKIKAKKRRNAGSFVIDVSADSTKFLVVSNPPFEKYAGEEFGFKVYSPDLKNLSHTELALPQKDKDVELVDDILGNDGKIYILTKITLEKKQKEKGNAPYYYSIFTVIAEDNSISENRIELPKMNIEDAAVRLNDERGELVCSGFYSDIKPNKYVGDDIDGFFNLVLDVNTWRTINSGTKKLDKKMIQQITGKKKIKEGRGISSTFEILKIMSKSDGSSTIISENRYMEVITTYTRGANGATSTSTDYHYYRNSIFIINVDKDGSIQSLVHIPKYQHTINDNGIWSSVLIMEKDDRLILVYNDNPKNMSANLKTIKDVDAMNFVGKAILVAAEVFNDGTVKKTKLSDNATRKIVLLPEQGFRIANGEYVIPTMVSPKACGCGCINMFKKAKLGLAKINF